MNGSDSTGVRSDAEMDRALFGAFSYAPSADVQAAADRRVRAAIELARGRAGGRGPGHPGPARVAGFLPTSRRWRAVTLLAAVLVLGGAGPGIVGLFERMVNSFGGWRTAWNRGAIVGVSQTIDGYSVTIERAYADTNQAMLGITVRDLGDRGWTQVSATYADVTDEQGRAFGHSGGQSIPDGSSVAANLAWLTPPVGLAPGEHTLRVSIPTISVRDSSTPPPAASAEEANAGDTWSPWHEIAGPWTFTIPLVVPGGSVARPDSAATIGGIEVRLSRVTVSPSSVNATLRVTGGGTAGQWAPIGQFEHAGASYPITVSSLGGGDGAITIAALDGTPSASGDWTLRIDELVGSDGAQQVRLAGPWEISFSMP